MELPMTVQTFPDLAPAARRMADLVLAVPDSLLSEPTPCPEYTLGDLLDHVGGFARAFTAAATKAPEAEVEAPRPGDASQLEDGWRTRIARDLRGMADAWRDPQAWTGMTKVGGVDLPGEAAGVIGLDELVVHGWDVARASRQPYDCDTASLEAIMGFVALDSPMGQLARSNGIFGPPVELPAAGPLLDRVIGLTGRQPAW
jgi:uncharacterized protein (TIGR03086 family)